MEMQRRAAEVSDSLGLTDRHVFFNDDWVPYKHLYDYLREADIGISPHHESVETLLSYRTRMLDYLQAELSVVATTGDPFPRLLEDEGLGRTSATKTSRAALGRSPNSSTTAPSASGSAATPAHCSPRSHGQRRRAPREVDRIRFLAAVRWARGVQPLAEYAWLRVRLAR